MAEADNQPEVVEISVEEVVMEAEVAEAEEVEIMVEEAVVTAVEVAIMITKMRQIILVKIDPLLKEVIEQRITSVVVKNQEQKIIFNLRHKIHLVMESVEVMPIIETKVNVVEFKVDGTKAIHIINVVVIIVVEEDVIINLCFLLNRVNFFSNFSIKLSHNYINILL